MLSCCRGNAGGALPPLPWLESAATNAANPPAMTAHSNPATIKVPIAPKVRMSVARRIATSIAPNVKPMMAPPTIPRRLHEAMPALISRVVVLVAQGVRWTANRSEVGIALTLGFPDIL